jgi:hypothetical protein
VHGAGRPPTLTPRIEHAICELTANGVPLVDAARAIGVGERTVYRWVKLGRAGYGPLYVRLVRGLEDARRERAHDVAVLLAVARERTL